MKLDMDTLREIARADGLFVGMLDDAEYDAFCELVDAGYAARSYEGAGGLMGIAKVRITAAGRDALLEVLNHAA